MCLCSESCLISFVAFQGHTSGKKVETEEMNGVSEEEEEEDEDDESSDPDIEEEIQASTQQDGPG